MPALVRHEANFNAKEVLLAKPDVVICNNAQDAADLRELGLTAVMLTFRDFDGLKESVTIMAQVLGGDAPRRPRNSGNILTVT